MRKTLLGLLFATCIAANVAAQGWLPLQAGYDPATIAWASAVVTAGGAVSATQQWYVNSLIVGLKKGSINYFTSCDRIWLHASENTQQATIDIVNRGLATKQGTVTFTANKGFTGDGTTGYFTTGFNGGSNYTLANASLASYVLNARTASNAYTEIGQSNGTGSTLSFLTLQPTLLFYYTINATTDLFGTYPTANTQGFWLASRSSSSSAALYLNGSSTPVLSSSSTMSAAGFPPNAMTLLARNDTGHAGVEQFSADQVGITAICGGFTGAQAAEFMTLINAYMTSVGANVY